MSNRLRLTPPQVDAYAKAYRCQDCTARSDRPRSLAPGGWLLTVVHDDDCPAVRGVVSLKGATEAALRAVRP